MAKQAVVLGASGQLAAELRRELQERGYSVAAWDRSRLDVTDSGAVEKALTGLQADVIFNAAAYNQVDVAEKEAKAAFEVNALAVRNMAAACRQTDTLLVHFSTDYVFDGCAGHAYTEEEPTHPLGAYAVSKLAGELYARAYLDRVLIVRTSGVFGPAGRTTGHGNFVETMLRLAAAGQPIRVVQDFSASPTYAPWLAGRSIDLAERGLAGIFHVGGGTPISWFEFARMIFEVAGLSPSLQPVNEKEFRTVARRPKYSALSNAKMERAGLEPMPPLRRAVEDYFARRTSAPNVNPA